VRVELRDVTSSDVEIFFQHQLDAEARAMSAFPARDHPTHVAHWNKILADDSTVTKTILVGDEVAGNVGSWIADSGRELGYWLGREHWGRGVATAALSNFLELLEERPLHAHVAEHNVASMRVLEKCGFQRSQEKREPEADGVRLVAFQLS
jgi:RimJ/RimL family protein N-acetyltransferase